MATRKLRLDEQTQKAVAVGMRGVDSLLREGKKAKENIAEFVKSINGKELKALVDEVTAKDQMVKALEKEVDIAKLILITRAREEHWKNFSGDTAMVEIKSSTTTKMIATALAQLLRQEGKTQLFDSMVSVKIGEVKKVLGEDAAKDFSTTSFEEFASVSLKPLNK